MIRFTALGRKACAHADEPLTTDSAGIAVAVDLSGEYDGLAATLVFEAGDASADVPLMGQAVTVPSDVLAEPGERLYMGVWASDAGGTVVIPTVWAHVGTVTEGTRPSGVEPVGPAPSWAAQVQGWAEDAHDTAERLAVEVDGWEDEIGAAVGGAERVDATVTKSGGVATVTVTDRTGTGHTVTVMDGAKGEAGRDGYSPSAKVLQGDGSATISITDKDGTTTATVHDGTNGRDGRDGTDGADGFSPTATVTQAASGATISIIDKSGTTTASVSNGTDGTDGTDGVDGFSPTVDVQSITGGHEVTITDADGAHSFDVMDGDPSAPGSITDAMLAPDGVKAQVAQLFGNQLVGELSGTIDTAADAYAAPPMALTVEGASTQAGTPTPDAPVPILSVDDLLLEVRGKNLLDASEWASGFINASNGSITSSSTAHYTVNYSQVIQGAYMFTMERLTAETNTVRLHGYDKDKRWLRQLYTVALNTGTGVFSHEVTIPDDVKYVRMSCHLEANQFQLELGSTATAYEPYHGTTVPLYDGTLRSLPDGTKDTLSLSYLRPSTRAGWAWYSRELTRAVGHVADMGELAWNYNANRGRSNSLMGVIVQPPNSLTPPVLIAEKYVPSPYNIALDSHPEAIAVSPTNGQLILYAANASDLPTGEMDYKLATPVTTTLDPIELPELPTPNCTVWCDPATGLQMGYVRDTGIVIARLESAIADLATS